MMLGVVWGVVSVAWFFAVHRYLPQPFTYDTNNTFWDYVIPAYWAHRSGAYDVWNSIYPPISFVFLRIFSLDRCYVNPSENTGSAESYSTLAHCDWVAQATIVGLYLLNVVLTYRALKQADPTTALPRGVAIALGLPLLFALERGNLILVCYTFFVLGYSRLIRTAWVRWVCMAISINFKPYMVLTILPLAARRRWRWLEGCGIMAVLVYLVSLTAFGAGTPAQLIGNQLNWVQQTAGDDWWSIYASTTLMSFRHAILGDYPLLVFVGSKYLEAFALWTPIIIKLGQAGVVLAMITAWLRSGAASTAKLGALGISLVLTSTNPGGYVTMFLIFLVFLEPWRGFATGTAIVSAYLLLIPRDYILIGVREIGQPSWLGNSYVSTDFGISVGQLARPSLILVIQFALIASVMFTAVRQAAQYRAAQLPLAEPDAMVEAAT